MVARNGPLYQEGAGAEGDWGRSKAFSPPIAVGDLPPL